MAKNKNKYNTSYIYEKIWYQNIYMYKVYFYNEAIKVYNKLVKKFNKSDVLTFEDIELSDSITDLSDALLIAFGNNDDIISNNTIVKRLKSNMDMMIFHSSLSEYRNKKLPYRDEVRCMERIYKIIIDLDVIHVKQEIIDKLKKYMDNASYLINVINIKTNEVFISKTIEYKTNKNNLRKLHLIKFESVPHLCMNKNLSDEICVDDDYVENMSEMRINNFIDKLPDDYSTYEKIFYNDWWYVNENL